VEQGKVLCFLRYQWQGEAWKKLATDAANQLLEEQHPHYLFYSTVKSAHLHAVSVADITIHLKVTSAIYNNIYIRLWILCCYQ
jgi:predicted nucleotidyltransferase